MRLPLVCLGAASVAALILSSSAAPAQYGYPQQGAYPNYQPACPVRVAPDMCGSYFYCTDGCTWYGPSYCVYPPFAPFNGMLPKGGPPTPCQYAQQKQQQQNNVAFPINPWTRSPRDFFMWTEAQQETMTRQNRPAFVP